MFRALILCLLTSLLASGKAYAQQAMVVWMEPTVPDEKTLKKADNKTGPAVHMSHVDLAFPPQPATADDDKAYEAVKKEIAAGKAIWNEFEVEYGIATDMEASIAAIDIVRDERDLQDLVGARLFQGAAVYMAFGENEFATGDRAEPFRYQVPGLQANNPWVQAMALDPMRVFTGADLPNNSAFPSLQEQQEVVRAAEGGKLDIAALPDGATLFLDGREVADDTDVIDVRPGTHYTHVVRRKVVCGRQEVAITSGETTVLPLAVNETELGQARTQVLEKTTVGFPQPVKEALEVLGKSRKGPIFVAAVDDGKVVVLPYARGARLVNKRPVTVVATGEIGGGAVISPIFEESDGSNVTAPGAHGGLSLEFGIYNFMITGGFDVGFTPANTVAFANDDETDNIYTSVLPQGWGGVGVYFLRPTGDTPTVHLIATYGWYAPAFAAFGGRLGVGIPVDSRGTWFRITLGGAGAPGSLWDDQLGKTIPLYQLFLRVGLATRF